ncbi:Lrp/AsnC family transcriptional regulator [Streptantibioticus ferralitis]|uniref:Lrp/AsnC family transcriptional regulator n=1 Tax=Streptantibioticus ferralitis TaxID=236510 RepID=A0ABT5YTZ9_9ACTN|nr:Lrp/AsnC family transcriptional regulator [Streptantibioticus ferralitis]MDF2255087.1 Lrp/AsnC family transcriptional regulator [Streptantibioticus ferralitis]
MNSSPVVDATDARILLALADDPRATVLALAERLRLSRNTVQARLAKLDENGALGSFERRVDPGALGYPLTAFVTAQADQHRLAEVADRLKDIPEIVEVFGLSGQTDLLVRVVAADTEDLYRVAGKILDCPGVERTSTALAMRELVPHRLTELLRRAAEKGARGARPSHAGRRGRD